MHLQFQSRVTTSGPHVCAVCLKPTWNRPSTSFGIVCRHICTKDTNFTFLNTNCSIIGTTLRSCHCWSFLCLCWLNFVSNQLIYGSIQIESVSFGSLVVLLFFLCVFYLNVQVSGFQHFRFRQVCFGFQISLIGTKYSWQMWSSIEKTGKKQIRPQIFCICWDSQSYLIFKPHIQKRFQVNCSVSSRISKRKLL